MKKNTFCFSGSTGRKSLFAAVSFLAFFLAATLPARGASVRLEWRIILAGHKNTRVDPRLKDIYRDLGTVFNYASFELLNQNQISLSPNHPVSISLPDRKTCIIRVTSMTKQRVHVQIQIMKNNRSLFGTAVRLMNGRTLILGGPSGKGKALIFALRSFW
jgi:hypothetical protein